MSGRLLLLDGHSLAYRAFYALPVENFATTTGQPTNAVYGFTAMLINAIRDEKPTHVAVAFDRPGPTFRHEAYAEYKATRTKAPDEFRAQLELIRDVLDAMRIPHLDVEGYEADDVIATLATMATTPTLVMTPTTTLVPTTTVASAATTTATTPTTPTPTTRPLDVLVVTGDRDALQLVGPHLTVLMTRRGISDMTRFTPEEMAAKYGLTPEQYPDFAALRGDPSDNLPSVPGVGEKTATKWVREFGSLAALADRVDEVPGKVGDALRAHLAQVLQNRRLTELHRDVPLGIGIDELEWHGWDRDEVHRLFDTLQFRVLRERLAATLPNPELESETSPEISWQTLEAGGLAPWLAVVAEAANPPRVGLSVTGRWARGSGDVEGMALAPEGGDGVYVVAQGLDAADEAALSAWLARADCPKAIHDGKGALIAMACRGWRVAGLTSDTALAAYLVAPGQRTFDLADLCVRYLGWNPTEEGPGAGAAGGDQLTLEGGTDLADADTARRQVTAARAVADLAAALEVELAGRGGAALLGEVELPLEQVLADMESVGIAVDTTYLEELHAELSAAVREAERQAHGAVGREFNLSSPKQLQQILFDELALPKTKRIKTGYTTDAEALASLALQRPDVELLQMLLRHRDVSRLRTVVESLLAAVADDGRIHTTFQQTVAATGRLSSVEPNLQNIPIRTAEGRRIRRAFVVGPARDAEGAPTFESLMTADYSQIEMRIMAHLSGDEGLIAAFTSGEDLHTYVAAQAHDIPTTEVTPEMRRRIKAMSYGLAYGLSAYGLSQQLRITPEEARAQMDRYFTRFGGVRDYLASVVAQARTDGFTQTLLGRRRYLPDLTSDNRQRREMAERMALNAPIQGSAADVVKVAMLRVERSLRAAGLRTRMLLQVHDELVLEVAAGERATAERLVRTEMAQAYTLRVPLDVSVGFGRTWDDAAHL